jgi:hypothetical protein
MSFCLRTPSGSPEIPKVGIPVTLGPINLCANLWLRWGLKQSYSPHLYLSNDMWHATFTQGNQGDSRLLVLMSLSFGHNLCFNCPNGSCEPILNIYVPRAFQWYKEFFNPMGFNPFNHSLKIWESTGTLTPKVGAHLGVWGFIPSHSPTLLGAWNVTISLHTWPAPL